METTLLSTKGQIVLPKAMRTSRAWGPGTKFLVEETGDGILLRPAGRFSGSRSRASRRLSATKRKSKTPAQMGTAIRREVVRRYDRGRY